jgi:hypothetical protein
VVAASGDRTPAPKSGQSSAGGGSNDTERKVQEATEQVSRAKGKVEKAKAQIKRAGVKLLKIIADELGITDAVNCVTQGDVGACIATARQCLDVCRWRRRR